MRDQKRTVVKLLAVQKIFSSLSQCYIILFFLIVQERLRFFPPIILNIEI